MGIFGHLLGGKAKGAIQQLSGNKDALEGICAACALVGAADGTFDDDEYEATLTAVKANSNIAGAFNGQEIENVLGKMQPKVANRSGRSQLKNEIREAVAKDKTGTMGQTIMLAALDVADQGEIDEKEMVVLRDLAGLCNVNLDKLLAG